MPFVRALFLLLLLASALLFLMYAVTGQVRYKNLGLIVLKWTIFAGLGFFTVLIAQRLSS